MQQNYVSEQSTNFMSTPFSKLKTGSKQILIEDIGCKFEQDNSNTLNFNDIQLPQKITVPTDQQVTIKTPIKMVYSKNKINIAKKQSKLNIKQQSHQYNACPSDSNTLPIAPINKKVQSILKKESLRQRYIDLLPPIYRKKIGHQHTQLIKIMGFIDNTIQFIAQNRSLKFIFFEDLKRQIKDSLRITISLAHIQQILFLDENIYEVKWQYNQAKRDYDLQIILTKFCSKDQRKSQMRRKIIQFLSLKEKNQIQTEDKEKLYDFQNWSKQFDPQEYQIPCKSLPVHPQTKNSQIRNFQQKNINMIQNQNLKQLIKKKKQLSEVASLKSNEVLQNIFNKRKDTKKISQTILQAIKQKQKNLDFRKNDEKQVKESLNKESLKQLCQQIVLIYVSKGVTNMFKVGLIQLLKGRTKFASAEIQTYLNFIICLKEISFLKEISTSNKSLVIQINKSKMKQMLQKIQALNSFDTSK